VIIIPKLMHAVIQDDTLTGSGAFKEDDDGRYWNKQRRGTFAGNP